MPTMILNEAEINQRLAAIQLLVTDVDGVLTDGGLYYTEQGDELKRFNVKDGQGIKALIQAGFEVAIISASDSAAIHHRARKLGIPHVQTAIEDKLTALQALCQRLNLQPEHVAYIGDDINDLAPMKWCGLAVTVADAMTQNQQVAMLITQRAGGQGAVRELCDRLIHCRAHPQKLPTETYPTIN